MTESQICTSKLSETLSYLRQSNKSAQYFCTSICTRSKTLESLTSPASDASAALALAGTNLANTFRVMQEISEKFETLNDCKPTIQRFFHGSREMLLTVLYEAGLERDDMEEKDWNKLDNNNIEDISINEETNTLLHKDNLNDKVCASHEHGKDDNDSDGQEESTMKSLGVTNQQPQLVLTEQDVYAAADSMEIIKDSHSYFSQKTFWKSTPFLLEGLERMHHLGIEGMCMLIRGHLLHAGPAIRPKRVRATTNSSRHELHIMENVSPGLEFSPSPHETAKETRLRLSNALKNRDLMKSVGDYQEFMPLDTRKIRELRAIVECLGEEDEENKHNSLKECSESFNQSKLLKGMSNVTLTTSNLGVIDQRFNTKIERTELIGSGYYTNAVQKPFKSNCPHLNAYANTRKDVACKCLVHYYHYLLSERKVASLQRRESGENHNTIMIQSGEMDSGARDVIRCLEHTLVIVQGEKSLFKCVVAPTQSTTHSSESMINPEYKYALIQAYSYVIAPVLDRMIDILESFFVIEARIGLTSCMDKFIRNSNVSFTTESVSYDNNHNIDVHSAASLAASGLRILDGVRMLGPSLAKLCEMHMGKNFSNSKSHQTDSDYISIVSNLCIGIHRITVKYCAQALELMVRSVKSDSFHGEINQPKDAVIAPVSSNVVRALVSLSPFVSAYKSVTKRRSLPWDPNVGDEAGNLDNFVKYILTRLLHNLQLKADKYKSESGMESDAKSNLFIMNNTLFLIEQIVSIEKLYDTTKIASEEKENEEEYQLSIMWFQNHVRRMFEASKLMYLKHWDNLNKHLTAVDPKDLEYQSSTLLSLESGRLLKKRFSGFNTEFEKLYLIHKMLMVVNTKFRVMLLADIKGIFLHRYKNFFDKYAKIQFSKKNMNEYLKYPPHAVENKVNNMFNLFDM